MGDIVMSPEERTLITSLFDRINQAATAPRDPEAEAAINEGVKRAPHAAYVMAQAVIVQEEGLKAASKRIEELEAKLRELESRSQPQQSTSFLGGVAANLFGGGRSASGIPSVAAQPQPQAQAPHQPGSVWNRGSTVPPVGPAVGQMPQQGYAQQPMAAPATGFGGGGSSFLGNALATAAGVAGGALLYDGLRSAFGGHGSSMLGGGMGGFTPTSTTTNNVTENFYVNNAAPAGGSGAGDTFPASAPMPPERPAFGDQMVQPASYDGDQGGGFFGGADDFSGSSDDSDWA
jgi:hypothetical protein